MVGPFKRKFLGIFSEDLGIDLGTSNTLICMKNKGVILNEPSVVTTASKNNSTVVGKKAKMMMGRTHQGLTATKPLKNGVIADYQITEKMLRAFYAQVLKPSLLRKPRVVICVPAEVTQVEKRAVIDVTIEAGAGEAFLVEEPMAAAIGAGIDIFEPNGQLILDIGGGTSEIAVISLSGLVQTNSLKIAGDRFDEAIIHFIRERYNLIIGDKTAEDVKINVGSVIDLEEELTFEVSGRNILTGLPKNMTISSVDIKEALEETLVKITDELKVILENTNPELLSDIKRNGITLAGGGALLRGLDERISSTLNLDVHVAPDPLFCVINGINTILEDFKLYKDVVLISAESDY